MSKELEPFHFSPAEAGRSLVELERLLMRSSDLSEAADVVPFFAAHPHLMALAGDYHLPNLSDVVSREFDLFGNFRCDWAVGDSIERHFVLIEFEDARPDSIFESDSRYHERWGTRFERGFSQLVDWFWIIDRYRDNVDFRRRFGDGHVTFSGLLVIGRDRYITPEQSDRLKWRCERVTINSHRISCLTFDGLHRFLDRRIRSLRGEIQTAI